MEVKRCIILDQIEIPINENIKLFSILSCQIFFSVAFLEEFFKRRTFYFFPLLFPMGDWSCYHFSLLRERGITCRHPYLPTGMPATLCFQILKFNLLEQPPPSSISLLSSISLGVLSNLCFGLLRTTSLKKVHYKFFQIFFNFFLFSFRTVTCHLWRHTKFHFVEIIYRKSELSKIH